jgi:hypothetical protein
VTKSDEVNKALQERAEKKSASCNDQLFASIDETKFRAGLDIEKSKQFILWANIGFTNQILDDMKNADALNRDYERVVSTLDGYFDELRKVFYAG